MHSAVSNQACAARHAFTSLARARHSKHSQGTPSTAGVPPRVASVTDFNGAGAADGDVVVLGVYLTCGTQLSALQLQAVLREAHLVLGLLSQPVVVRLRGALREEVAGAFRVFFVVLAF